MKIAFETNIGCARSENQDRVNAVKINDNLALAVICDGMGGENAGSEASETAIEIIFNRILNSVKEKFDENNLRNLLISSITAANSVIYNKSRQDESKFGMGTTCVIALVTEKNIHFMNVGDSRAYILSGNEIKQVTNDHTFVKMLLDQGKITEEELRSHPKKNYITKAVGVDSKIEPDYFEFERKGKMKILLCSDGLSNYCDNNKILEIVNTNAIENIPNQLINYVINANGKDNISLAIIEI